VDAEGEVLDVLVQTRRNKRAALKLMRKLLKKYGFVPDKLVTDELRSYAAAASHLGIAKRHERGRWRNKRRIRISQPDEGRGRCKGSRASGRRKDFSQCMQQSTTPSTSNVILHRQERTEPFGPQRCRHGTKSSPRREPDVPAELLRALFGNVTKPSTSL
jgi:transposase-like protein